MPPLHRALHAGAGGQGAVRPRAGANRAGRETRRRAAGDRRRRGALGPEGPLFLTPAANGNVLGPLQTLKNRLAEFARVIVSDPNVAPNHGWRHRFKTVGMEAGIPPRILDAIQGQAPRSVADTYGHVTLRTMAAEIGKLPPFDLNELRQVVQ